MNFLGGCCHLANLVRRISLGDCAVTRLVAHNRCWTADYLARYGLPHPEHCPLCDQATESIDHLLVLCVFAREFWFRLFSQIGLQAFSPQHTETSFHNWWERVSNVASEMLRKGINSLIILGEWTLWTHRNKCVFDGAAPSVAGALAVAEDERRSWSLAGLEVYPSWLPSLRVVSALLLLGRV